MFEVAVDLHYQPSSQGVNMILPCGAADYYRQWPSGQSQTTLLYCYCNIVATNHYIPYSPCRGALQHITTKIIAKLSRDGRAKTYTNKSSRDNNRQDASSILFSSNWVSMKKCVL